MATRLNALFTRLASATGTLAVLLSVSLAADAKTGASTPGASPAKGSKAETPSAPQPAPARDVVLTKDGATRFLAIGRPSALRIVGKGSAPEGKVRVSSGQATGDLTVDLSTFTTENGLRDRHMKEKYLEVDKGENKIARLTIEECSVPALFFDGEKASAPDLPFKGRLALHGETRPVAGSVSLVRTGDAVKGDAKFELKISDFKIGVPSFAGITVAENVEIEVALAGASAAGSKAAQ